MKLRTFIAPSTPEAMAQIRQSMGEDAIIVSTLRRDNGGVEVTAAVEHNIPSHAVCPESDTTPDPDKKEPDDIETRLEALLQARLMAPLNHSPGNVPSPAARIDTPEEKTTRSPISELEKLAHALEYHNLPAHLRETLLAAVEASEEKKTTRALAVALESCFSFDPVSHITPATLILVGLPGAGKTVTHAKLAARISMEGLPVQLVSADTSRTGAQEQGKAYAKLLRQDIHHTHSPDALRALLKKNIPPTDEKTTGTGVCLIDTTSVNPFDIQDFKLLDEFVRRAQDVASAEPVLVLSALTEAQTMIEAAHSFASLGVRRLIITQTDIVPRLGNVLAAAKSTDMSFAQISTSPYIARNLFPLDAVHLARLLLRPKEKSPSDRKSS